MSNWLSWSETEVGGEGFEGTIGLLPFAGPLRII